MDDITSRDLSSSGKKLLMKLRTLPLFCKILQPKSSNFIRNLYNWSVTRGQKKVPHADFAHFQVGHTNLSH